MSNLDILSFSQSTKDGRCLEVWFRKNVTAEDRAALLSAINAAPEIERLRIQLVKADEACQRLCGKHGFATGHGDTVADMIDEINAQIPFTDD